MLEYWELLYCISRLSTNQFHKPTVNAKILILSTPSCHTEPSPPPRRQRSSSRREFRRLIPIPSSFSPLLYQGQLCLNIWWFLSIMAVKHPLCCYHKESAILTGTCTAELQRSRKPRSQRLLSFFEGQMERKRLPNYIFKNRATRAEKVQ